MTGKLKEQIEKLKEQRYKNNTKSKTIEKRKKKNWKALDKKLKSLKDEELLHGLSNLQMKSTVLSFFKRQERRKNLRGENYDSEEDEEEKKKARKLIADSEKHFKEWLKNKEQYPFDHNNFGKKQKKDIKGMIKKILLYGGLPTLLVVSLGVLSNKKVTPNRVKKNIKVKANDQEKLFKQAFVIKLKEYYKTKGKEIKNMGEEERKNLADTIKREENRNKKFTNPDDKLIEPSKIQIKKPPTVQELVAKGLLAQNVQNKTIPKNPAKKKNQRKKKLKFTIGPMEEGVI